MYNRNNNFLVPILIIIFIIGFAASIYVDFYILGSNEIPTWAKLMWFFSGNN